MIDYNKGFRKGHKAYLPIEILQIDGENSVHFSWVSWSGKVSTCCTQLEQLIPIEGQEQNPLEHPLDWDKGEEEQ